jgi:hypothetical protein
MASMVSKVKQPKKVFKVLSTISGDYGNPRTASEVIENALNNGFLIATDLVDALRDTNLIVLVKNE